jgi:hypothetical protein
VEILEEFGRWIVVVMMLGESWRCGGEDVGACADHGSSGDAGRRGWVVSITCGICMMSVKHLEIQMPCRVSVDLGNMGEAWI